MAHLYRIASNKPNVTFVLNLPRIWGLPNWSTSPDSLKQIKQPIGSYEQLKYVTWPCHLLSELRVTGT